MPPLPYQCVGEALLDDYSRSSPGPEAQPPALVSVLSQRRKSVLGGSKSLLADVTGLMGSMAKAGGGSEQDMMVTRHPVHTVAQAAIALCPAQARPPHTVAVWSLTVLSLIE